jgi:outer membrane protein OmpA-like peptidoglycan-associated protein
LVKKYSVPKDQVEANGQGASYMIADGQTERGRLLNERVEFRIVRF